MAVEPLAVILMIDNYDSFTYNVVQCIGSMGAEVEVYRNDKITVEEIEAKRPPHIVLVIMVRSEA